MSYTIRFVHKIAPRDTDVQSFDEELFPEGYNYSAKNVARTLRRIGVLAKGQRLRELRVEPHRLVAFPEASVWHSLTIERPA